MNQKHNQIIAICSVAAGVIYLLILWYMIVKLTGEL